MSGVRNAAPRAGGDGSGLGSKGAPPAGARGLAAALGAAAAKSGSCPAAARAGSIAPAPAGWTAGAGFQFA